jgi:hypothetical protein
MIEKLRDTNVLNSAGIGTLIRIPYIRVLALTDDFLYATS